MKKLTTAAAKKLIGGTGTQPVDGTASGTVKCTPAGGAPFSGTWQESSPGSNTYVCKASDPKD